jgi:hypothetical protein
MVLRRVSANIPHQPTGLIVPKEAKPKTAGCKSTIGKKD